MKQAATPGYFVFAACKILQEMTHQNTAVKLIQKLFLKVGRSMKAI
jgi:hypothetical protein